MKFLLATILVLLSIQASASKLASEISYLKSFIANSPCTFNRNGDLHSPREALEHIQKKHDYFEDDIHTAEDFIEKSASKSTMSGKAYTVICPAQEGQGQQTITSRTWLLRALSSYRNQHNIQ